MEYSFIRELQILLLYKFEILKMFSGTTSFQVCNHAFIIAKYMDSVGVGVVEPFAPLVVLFHPNLT